MKLSVGCAVCGVSAIASCLTSYSATVPNDFALQAHIAPGGGPGAFDVSSAADAEKLPKPWDLKFNASGHGRTVVFHTVLRAGTLDMREVRQKISVSTPMLLKLLEVIDKAKFFSIPGELCSEPLEHTGGTYLKVTMNGHTH